MPVEIDPNKLIAAWDEDELDIVIAWPKTKTDAFYLQQFFNEDFVKEITKRGYDITTMKFEISLFNQESEDSK